MRSFRPAPGAVAITIMFAISCVSIVTAQEAQSRDQFVISARAGGINAVSGKVMLRRSASTQLSPLTAKDNLDQGETVMTGADGRVEVLLNPGSYLRVAENSEFVFTDTSLDDLQINLTKGSAVVEASGIDDIKFQIQIATPRANIAIAKRGIYRINILSDGPTEVMVFKGRALVGDDGSTIVKDGKKVVVGGAASEVAKFDKKNRDEFDLWSRERADVLARSNRKLSSRAFANTLASFDWPTLDGRIRSGVWVYNPAARCYTFAPLYNGWSSPYGSGYSNFLVFGGSNCNGCPQRVQVYHPTPAVHNPNPGAASGSMMPAPTPGPTGNQGYTPSPSSEQPSAREPGERHQRQEMRSESNNIPQRD